MWYVIQTQSGKEELIKIWIQNEIPQECYGECRIIYSERKRKYGRVWHVEKRKMFPGYLFLITDRVLELKQELRKIPERTRILGTGDEIVPIAASEERILQKLCGDDDVVEMSVGIQEGDRIKVTEGSLKGLETIIRKVDRHKRIGYIEVELLNQTRLMEVGLEIVEKK